MYTEILTDREEVGRLFAHIQQIPLDYPQYSEWLKKCRREVELGYKTAIVTRNEQEAIVGSLIVQRDKKDWLILEPKNLIINSRYNQQGVGSQLINTLEAYARENCFKKIRGDIHEDNPLKEFLIKRRFKIGARETLYSAETELIICKDLNSSTCHL